MHTATCSCWRHPTLRLALAGPAALAALLATLLAAGPGWAQLSQPPVIITPEPLNIAPGDPLSPIALVSQPAPIKGVQSWTLETRRHRGWLHCLALSPDLRLLATGGLDGAIRIWDIQSGQFLRALVGHHYNIYNLSWSPDGNTLASAGGSDGTARLWNPHTGQPLRILRGHKGYVSHVAWSPDGKTLIAAGGHSGFVTRWEAVSSKQTRTVELGRPVTCVAWSPDGKTLACSGVDFAAQLHDAFLNGPPRSLGQEGEITINTLAWSPDGKTLAGGDSKKTYLWEAETAKRLQAWDVPSQSLAWAPEGNLLAAAFRNDIRIHDASTGKVNKTLTDPAHALVWPASSSRLVACSLYQVSLWDITASKPHQVLELAESLPLVWAPGKPLLAGLGGKSPTVWDLATAKQLTALEGHKGTVTTAAWSPKGKILAYAASDKIVRFWDAAGKQQGSLEGHTGAVNAVAWSPSGKKLATAGSDKAVLIWETASGKLLTTFKHDNPVQALAWSPDGKLLAAGDNQQAVQLWRGDKDKGPPALTLKTQGPVYCLAWTPNSKMLASSNYNAIRFWEFPGGKLALNLDRMGYSPTQLSWSPNGAVLASNGHHTLPLWDFRSGKAIQSFWASGPVHHVAWTPSGNKVGASLSTRTVLFWNPQSKFRQGAIVGTDQWLAAITAKGHFAATPSVDNDLVYIALTDKGLETIDPKTFASKFAWKNNPAAAFAELAAK